MVAGQGVPYETRAGRVLGHSSRLDFMGTICQDLGYIASEDPIVFVYMGHSFGSNIFYF